MQPSFSTSARLVEGRRGTRHPQPSLAYLASPPLYPQPGRAGWGRFAAGMLFGGSVVLIAIFSLGGF